MSDIRKKLDAPIPESAVRERAGGGNMKLSYVDGFYVTSRMNDVFDLDWSYSTVDNTKVSEEKDDRGRWRISYEAHVRVDIAVRGEEGSFLYECSRSDYGHGHGIDADKGKAIESASKEAVTDARKRACATLGNVMGLALYDKDKTFVGGEDEDKPVRDAALAEVKAAVKKPAARKPRTKQTTIEETYSFTDGEIDAMIAQIDLARSKDDLEPVRTRLNASKDYTNRGILVEKFLQKKTQIESKGQQQ